MLPGAQSWLRTLPRFFLFLVRFFVTCAEQSAAASSCVAWPTFIPRTSGTLQKVTVAGRALGRETILA